MATKKPAKAKISRASANTETNATVWMNVSAVTPSGADKPLGGIPLDSERANAFSKKLAELVQEHGEEAVKGKLEFTITFRIVDSEAVDELDELFDI